MNANELETLIDEYIDGRLQGSKRLQFESQMSANVEFRKKVETATHSLEVFRQALSKIDPGRDFEQKVSNRIISITQSNPGMRPYTSNLHTGQLTASDPDAKLLGDPDASREKKRLMM